MKIEEYFNNYKAFKKVLVFRIGLDAGFFSEYNNMLFALSFCMKNEIQFKLYSDDANFAKLLGWQDFFLPFVDEVHDSFHHKLNYRYSEKPVTIRIRHVLGSFKKAILSKDFSVFRRYYKFQETNSIKTAKLQHHIDYFTQDIWYDINHHLDMKDLLFYNNLDTYIWKYNETTKVMINNIVTPKMNELLKSGGGYVALHIRRGDKYKESPIYSIQKYMEKVNRCAVGNCVFVATDDYSVFNELCSCYKTFSFFTLATQENSCGHEQDEYNKLSPENRFNKTISLFADVELMAKASYFIGTFSSNIGQYMAIRRNNKNCIYIDQ